MNLKRMLLITSMALVGAVFVAPAAQAQLLYEEGTGETTEERHEPLKVGATVVATGIEVVTHTVFGTLECSQVDVEGEVTENSASSSQIGKTTTIVNGCNAPITNPTAGTLNIGEEGAAEAAGAQFGAHISEELFCQYSGNLPLHYETNTDLLHITGENNLTGAPNPPCGQATITGTFTLETVIDTDPEPPHTIPVYIT